LAIGGYPHGFFGTPAHLIGYENLFLWYCMEPELMHDILDTFINIWLAVFEEVISQVEIDLWHIWEDISFGKGSMISIDMVKEFLNPYIKKIADFIKSKREKRIDEILFLLIRF
jgi:uroporphyrinogen-III decarboxylase